MKTKKPRRESHMWVPTAKEAAQITANLDYKAAVRFIFAAMDYGSAAAENAFILAHEVYQAECRRIERIGQ